MKLMDRVLYISLMVGGIGSMVASWKYDFGDPMATTHKVNAVLAFVLAKFNA